MRLRRVIHRVFDRLPRAEEFQLTEALFLRLLGLVYLSSFGSFAVQIVGLVGSHGVQPASQFLNAIREQYGASAFGLVPTLFWLGISDRALVTVCVAGCVCGLLMASGYFVRLSAALCWVLYLSIVVIGQPFSNFQWDALLLEAGFLALFAGAPVARWAYRLLLFRLMFESGLVKLTSHDPNWRNLHALRFHFMTQPLPNPVAWYAAQLPSWALDSMTGVTLGIELAAPWFLFAPKRFRSAAVLSLIFMQVMILVTGNYAFFNYLTLALCLWGFDDSAFAGLARFLRRRVFTIRAEPPKVAASGALILLLVLGGGTCVGTLQPSFDRTTSRVLALVAPFEIVNTYGLFAVMTTTRPEIVIEGSNDQVRWEEYAFRHKPGDLRHGLSFVAPHQPRLDWQMWFAALGTYPENTWVGSLSYRLLTGEPSVLGLLATSPFAKPPKYIRATLYEYRFTTSAEYAQTGNRWQRTLLGPWYGPVLLRDTLGPK